MEFQTRSHNGDLRQFPTMEHALEHAQNDTEVWKISFTIPETQERIRLIKESIGWVLENIYGIRSIKQEIQ